MHCPCLAFCSLGASQSETATTAHGREALAHHGVRHKFMSGVKFFKNHENFVKTQRKLNHFCRVFAGCAAVPGQWFSAKKTWLKIGSLQTSKSGVVFFRPPGARALPPEARTASMLRWRGRFHRNAPLSDLERANTYVQGCINYYQTINN